MIPHLRGVAATQRGSNSHTTTMDSSGSLEACCSQEAPLSSATQGRRRNNSRFLLTGLCLLMGVGFLFVMDSPVTALQSSGQQQHDERHPLRPRKTLISAPSNEVRYLAFGGSSTWGDGLKHPNHEGYPYLLSLNAHNAAVKSGGFSLAAACTQTIVQEDPYDVIVIEFSLFDDSIAALAERLRERFPAATILFVRLWHPSQIKYRKNDNTVIDFNTFRMEHDNKPLEDTSLYFEVLKAGAERWFVDIPDQEAQIKSAASHVRARYLKLPVPEKDVFSYPVTMRKTMELFQDDDLSKHGHAVIAESIRSHIKESQIVSNPERNKLGSWGQGDQCNLWYSHGDFQVSGRRLRGVEFAHTGNSHRHALEVSDKGSSFEIHNPFHENRMLYLTYMTSSMDNDDEMRLPYPDVRVSLNGKATVMIEPYHDGSEKVEYARTSAVGHVPPGTSTVHLRPASRSRVNFRLVGASFLPSDVVHELPMLEFDLEAAAEAEPRGGLSSLFGWF